MPAYTQAQRFIAIGTPLKDKEAMLLKSFELTERLGQMYGIDAVMLCESETVDASKIVGQNVTIRLALRNGGTRYLNGMVSRFTQSGTEAGTIARYRATIVPNLWMLTRRSDCRIFQNMTAPDILKKVLEGLNVKWDVHGTYQKREYCVQYRETDFNFVSRLMEEEGIYYFFKHDDGQHTMVVCDSSGSHEPVPDYDQVPFHQRNKQLQGVDYVTDWAVEKSIQPGKFEQTDYDFKAPKKDLKTKAAVKLLDGDDKLEIFDYPGEYVEPGPGSARAKVRLQELQLPFETVYGHGDARGLGSGFTFKLTDHPREDQNKEYLVTSVTLRASVDDYETTTPGAGGGEPSYSCTFTAIDNTRQFRPPRLTPKPVVQGPQTAVVVGPGGEEIHTDEYGRIKLQFHWDRQSKADENSSCWVRVSQAWAGNKFGAMFLPRIGQEVIVDFLEGDPDQPIVTGRVYNASNMPPYKLPDNKTMSTTKTKSSKGGGPEDFNEIRFEDKKGEEQIFVQAQKNLDVRVENDRYVTIGHDDHLTVDNDKLEHVKNNRNETVDADHVEAIQKDRHLTVQGKEAKQVAGSHSFVVKGDVIEEFKAKQSTVVTGDHYLKAANIVIEAGTNVTIKVGQSYIAIEAGGIKIGTTGQIVLEAQGTLGAKGTGGVTIETPASLQAKGSMATVQGDATAEVKSPATTVKGDGMLTLKGGMVMIN